MKSDFHVSVLRKTSQNEARLQSKLLEGFLRSGRLVHLQHVEAHRLRQGPALADRHDVVESNVPVDNRNEILVEMDWENVKVKEIYLKQGER